MLRSIKAAIIILENNNIDTSIFRSKLENLDKKIRDVSATDINRIVMDYLKHQNPEIS